jgi:hypothetical protein
MVAQIDKAMLKKRPWKVPGRALSWALIEGRPLTTKGQFLNPLVFCGYRLAQYLPEAKGARAPIYIIGTGRSGTTVLGKLFAMHRETVFLNEPKALWHDAHGHEDIIGSYDMGPAQVQMGAEEARPDIATRIAKVYSQALRFGGASRVVDKYPELIFRVPFVEALFSQARFIAIVRDGVDTCSSVTGWSSRKGSEVGEEIHDWWGRDGRKWRLIVEQLVPEHADLAPLQDRLLEVTDHRDRAAVEWIVSMRAAASVAKNDSVMTVRYEELCAQPETVLPDLLNHCGLEPDAVFAEYAKDILSAAEDYASLNLMPELVAPFCAVLDDMGYGASVVRVRPRVTTMQSEVE